MPIIPASEWEGKFLSYPVGIADLEEITGIQFDIEQYREVAQYIYLGSLDDHDEFDIWADNYLGGDRQLIWDITSRDYLERFIISQQIYQELDIPADFVNFPYYISMKNYLGGIIMAITKEVQSSEDFKVRIVTSMRIPFVTDHQFRFNRSLFYK